LQSNEKIRVEQDLKRAATFLLKKELKEIMPDNGFELVYAASRARSPEMVGRTIISINSLQNTINTEIDTEFEVSFGDTGQLSSGILTAMRFSPDIRSSCSLKYSDKLIRICEKMLLDVCRLDASQIPPGVSTMDWAVAFCSEQDDGVPDIISVNSNDSGHSSFRIFGESPLRVTTNIIKIAERIGDETL
jgi:predicted fused transcriptional regulator/phosphomethylpyrimidine kinase